MDLLVGFGQLRILENSGEGLQRREGRRFSFQLLLPVSRQYIEVSILILCKQTNYAF